MKKIITFILILNSTFCILNSSAQAPLKFSYQAIIRDSYNALVKNKTVGMRISILGPTNNVVYKEKQTPTTNINGLISIEIGGGIVLYGSMSSINWGHGPYYIKTETDPNGGTSYSIIGSSQLVSVPYALYAQNCNTPGPQGPKGDTGVAGPRGADAVFPAGNALGQMFYWNGNAWVTLQPGLVGEVLKYSASGPVWAYPGIIPSVTICNQEWMVKNLDVDHYRNGDSIPQVTNNADWAALTTGAYCYYNNDSATYAAVYGKLYNWYAVNDPRGLAPEGWHVPSDSEWTTLRNCLGGTPVAGGPLKEAGTAHWTTPNTGATNTTGFTALPGGVRFDSGPFYGIGGNCDWWSSTEVSTTHAWLYFLNSTDGGFGRYSLQKQYGYSVRCLRD